MLRSARPPTSIPSPPKAVAVCALWAWVSTNVTVGVTIPRSFTGQAKGLLTGVPENLQPPPPQPSD
jgi:hypothetical protein